LRLRLIMPAPRGCRDCGVLVEPLNGRRVGVRRCTGERLCVACRQRPDNRLLSERQVLCRCPSLDGQCLAPALAGYRVNARDPRFERERVYRWRDLVLLFRDTPLVLNAFLEGD
jgi:hypothetical protein